MYKTWSLRLTACGILSAPGCPHVPYWARCLLQHQVQNASLSNTAPVIRTLAGCFFKLYGSSMYTWPIQAVHMICLFKAIVLLYTCA